MPSRDDIARAYDEAVGRDWRAAANERHRERTRWLRENLGSDQSIKRSRQRAERARKAAAKSRKGRRR